MFKKPLQHPKLTGPSFPFIEQRQEGLKLPFDALKVTHVDGVVTVTFLQKDVPMYAYGLEAVENYEVTFDKMLRGFVKVEFTKA